MKFFDWLTGESTRERSAVEAQLVNDAIGFARILRADRRPLDAADDAPAGPTALDALRLAVLTDPHERHALECFLRAVEAVERLDEPPP